MHTHTQNLGWLQIKQASAQRAWNKTQTLSPHTHHLVDVVWLVFYCVFLVRKKCFKKNERHKLMLVLVQSLKALLADEVCSLPVSVADSDTRAVWYLLPSVWEQETWCVFTHVVDSNLNLLSFPSKIKLIWTLVWKCSEFSWEGCVTWKSDSIQKSGWSINSFTFLFCGILERKIFWGILTAVGTTFTVTFKDMFTWRRKLNDEISLSPLLTTIYILHYQSVVTVLESFWLH